MSVKRWRYVDHNANHDFSILRFYLAFNVAFRGKAVYLGFLIKGTLSVQSIYTVQNHKFGAQFYFGFSEIKTKKL